MNVKQRIREYFLGKEDFIKELKGENGFVVFKGYYLDYNDYIE